MRSATCILLIHKRVMHRIQRLAGMSAKMRAFWAEIKDDSPYWETWKMK